jgi:hypothetical protein
MKYRVNYAYFDQSKMRAARWEQREKDFETMEEALLFVKKNDWNVSVRNSKHSAGSGMKKECTKCKENLDIRFFYINRRPGRNPYYRGECSMCYSVKRKEKGW